MQSQLKVIFQNETKKFKKPNDYDTLLQQTIKAFGSTLPQYFKFFYQDPDGDLISINCQEDLEEAYSSMPQLRLFVEASIEGARQQIEPDFSMRSSINMPMQMVNQNFEVKENRGISGDFQDVSYEEQKSSFRNQSSSANRPMEVSTDVQNLVNWNNVGCGAQIQTDEKLVDAIVDTKDMGSQINKDVKEACCDGSIQTESKGSQIYTEAKSQEINCQILRPEQQEEQISEEEQIVCFRCDGTKVNRKGLPCRRCNGSGTLTSKFYQDLQKILKEEIRSYTTQTFQRLMVDYLGKRAADQAAQVHNSITCDGCQTHPIQGIRYKCSVCPDFDFCEKCEAEKNHPHPMLKIRRPEQAPAFLQCSYQQEQPLNQSQQQQPPAQNLNQSQSSRKAASGSKRPEKKIYQARFVKENFGDRHIVSPGEKFTKTWVFRNNGEWEWPSDTLFIQTNGDELGATSQVIRETVQPGQEIEVVIECIAPKLPGKYCSFFRFVHGNNDRFGQKVWCDVLVQEPEIEMIKVQQPPAQELKESVFSEEQQERSSLLNENEPIIEEELQPIKLENIAQKLEQIVQEEPVVEQPLIQEAPKEEPVPEVKEEAKNEMKESYIEMTQEEKDKLQYLKDLDDAKITDQKIKDNLLYLLDVGYTTFSVNYALLKRNNNDLVVAINNLCNGNVSESMFQQK